MRGEVESSNHSFDFDLVRLHRKKLFSEVKFDRKKVRLKRNSPIPLLSTKHIYESESMLLLIGFMDTNYTLNKFPRL